MFIDRTIIYEKLKGFLENRISQDKTYEWALAQIVSQEYETASQNDQLLKETLQALVDINHDDAKLRPSQEDLTYCLRCLEGKERFESLSLRIQRRNKENNKVKVLENKRDLMRMMRIYIILFAVCSILVNIFVLIKPEFFTQALGNMTRYQLFREVALHLIYATVILIPIRILVRSNLYLLSKYILILGTIFYWSIDVSITLRLNFHPLMIFVFAPFTGVPATVALVMLIEGRRQIVKEE